MTDLASLDRQIQELQRRLEDLQKRLPAHSIPPAMIAELDALDSALAEKLQEWRALQKTGAVHNPEDSPGLDGA